MMLVGLIWAVAAPLLLLPVAAFLTWILKPTGWSRHCRGAVATVIIVLVTGVVWWIDYREFVTVCNSVGRAKIFMRAQANGIFLDSPTANSFGMNYLHQQGFAWMEMQSIYDRNKIKRVTRETDGQIRTVAVDAITAHYEVRETFEQLNSHISVDMKRVFDRKAGTLMAQAGSVHFDGGRAKWVLGVYGSRHYPDARTHGDDFQTYYYLAQRTLR